MKVRRPKPGPQQGFALVEALISVVVLAIGVMGLLYFQGFLISSATVGNQRVEASLLAEELVSMASADPINAGCYANSGVTTCASAGARDYLTAWVLRATARLPGADTLPPTAVLANDRTYTVTLQWKQKDGGTIRNHRVATQIGG
jgi:type IV pilus assembly protein PilV